MESHVIIKATEKEMNDFFEKDDLCSVKYFEPKGRGNYQATICHPELPESLQGTFTIRNFKAAVKRELRNNQLCENCRHITLENRKLGRAYCDKYSTMIEVDITKHTNEYKRCRDCMELNELTGLNS